MAPVSWSTSYLLREPLGISTMTSTSMALHCGAPGGTGVDPGRPLGTTGADDPPRRDLVVLGRTASPGRAAATGGGPSEQGHTERLGGETGGVGPATRPGQDVLVT